MNAAKKLRKDRQSFNSIVEKIEAKRFEIERFYDWKIEEGQSSKNFAFMMTVDSSFLLCFLFGLLRDQSQYSGSSHNQPQPGTAPSQPRPMTAPSGSHDEPESAATPPSGSDQLQPAGAPSRGSQPSDDDIVNLSAIF